MTGKRTPRWRFSGMGMTYFKYHGRTFYAAELRDREGKQFDMHVVIYDRIDEWNCHYFDALNGVLYGVPKDGEKVDEKWLEQADRLED